MASVLIVCFNGLKLRQILCKMLESNSNDNDLFPLNGKVEKLLRTSEFKNLKDYFFDEKNSDEVCTTGSRSRNQLFQNLHS